MDFVPFPKIARLSREIIVTEKIDGTNACVVITDEGQVLAGSRTRWVTPEDDNHGFAKWVKEHEDELRRLGPGKHFGEWWGCGINKGYGLSEKRFSLFNVSRWAYPNIARKDLPSEFIPPPPCCGVVPVLYHGVFTTQNIEGVLEGLRSGGSRAAPSFMRPEGVMVYHTASNTLFKKTLEKDDAPKSR